MWIFYRFDGHVTASIIVSCLHVHASLMWCMVDFKHSCMDVRTAPPAHGLYRLQQCSTKFCINRDALIWSELTLCCWWYLRTLYNVCVLQLTPVCNATKATSSKFPKEIRDEAKLSFLRKLRMHAGDESNSACGQLRRAVFNRWTSIAVCIVNLSSVFNIILNKVYGMQLI